MKFFLNPRDRAELHQLFQTNKRNYAVTDLLSMYFHSCARSLTKKEIFQEMEKRGADEETAFFFCLMRLMNVDPGEYRRFDSIRKGIHRLDPSRYEKNPFLQHIRFPESWKGNARFSTIRIFPMRGSLTPISKSIPTMRIGKFVPSVFHAAIRFSLADSKRNYLDESHSQ